MPLVPHMTAEQAKTVVHAITGIPEDAEVLAISTAWEIGRACIQA